MKTKVISIIIGILLLGTLGALFFNVFVLPYLLTNTYFERFDFVKDFKSGKIIINPKEQVYIQENIALESAIEKVTKSVAAIQVTTLAKNSYIGSGLIATSDGLIVILANLVPVGSKFNIFINGEKVDFKIQKSDYKKNLILIKVDKSNLPTVGFADFDKIKLGQRVFLIAASSVKAKDWLVNEGIVRSFDINTIKTNISEKSIVSGSPLFNITGELVGLSYTDSDGMISVVPVNVIKAFLGL
ncbi:MAG: serine protease [Candidatus Staskawiczbacteria bacterium]|nr:serine protease [Candidatus Staskawiczbacteria bacterium]MBI3337273.1 serine protease [Candidatus Staskawiczbacteria bacterium]